MTVNPYTTQQEVLALLKELTTIPVFEGSVPDGADIPLTPSGKIKPHIVLSWAGLTEAPTKYNGITGAKDDSYMQGFSTHAIAGDDDAARQVHNVALMKLLGFVPYGCGEIRPAFFAGVGEISSLGQPTRYSAVQAYKFLMNSVTPAL
jgi:hypothetical protein